MKAFLRKVRSLLQRQITKNLTDVLSIKDIQIAQMKKSLVSEQIVKFVKSDILDIEDSEDHIFKD